MDRCINGNNSVLEGGILLRTIVHSILLAFQFFTVVPVQRELPLTKPTITGMFSFLPWLGACMGAVMATVFYSLQQWTDISSLLTAFLLVVGFIICTGGLHLDGWVDMGDAFFHIVIPRSD